MRNARQIATSAVHRAQAEDWYSSQINVPFDEPLAPEEIDRETCEKEFRTWEIGDRERRRLQPRAKEWDAAERDELFKAIGEAACGLIIAGPEAARDLQEAELILVRDELPIIPLFFYMGVNYFDPTRIEGIYPNIVDQHPLQFIRKVKRTASPDTALN